MVKAIVISGPPCTGKSTIAAQVAKRLGAIHLEMDAARLRLTPGVHTQETRQIAYRAIHLIGEHLLGQGHSVVFDATYGPFTSRQDLDAVVQRCGVEVYLIQCKLDRQVAAGRYEGRRASGEPHAATDLNSARVATLADTFPYTDTGLILDTKQDIGRCVESVVNALHLPSTFDRSVWLRDPDPVRG